MNRDVNRLCSALQSEPLRARGLTSRKAPEVSIDPAGTIKITSTKNWLTVQPKPLNYIFEGNLVAGSIGYITGVGGTGKSTFMICFVFSLCTGGEIFETFRPARPFRVLYCCAEDNEDIVRMRFYYTAQQEVEHDRARMQKAIDENLILFCNQPLPLLKLKNGSIEHDAGLKELQQIVKRERPDIVILDPKSCFYGDLDENSNSHNSAFIDCLKTVTALGCTVIFTHHEGKARASSGSQFSSRGGQALSDGARWQITLSHIEEKEAGKLKVDTKSIVKVTQVKSNYTTFFNPFYLQRDANGALSRVDFAEQREARTLNAVKQVLHSGITCKPRDLDREAGRKFADSVIDITGQSKRETTGIVKALIKAEKLQTDTEGHISEL